MTEHESKEHPQESAGGGSRAKRAVFAVGRSARIFYFAAMGSLSANTNKVNAPLIPPDTHRIDKRGR